MTHIKPFGASAARAADYNNVYRTMFQKGAQLEGTEADQRAHVDGVTMFAEDQVTVNTNRDKQVLLSEVVRGKDVDYNYVPEDVEDQVDRQTYRMAMKPDRFGVLHVVERVDSRDSKGQVVASWMRMVETDPNSEAFSMYFPT